MQGTEQFSGLGMPVFTAFSWEGEETALSFALSQLELFADAVYRELPDQMQPLFEAHGLSHRNQGAYLAFNSDFESDGHIAFYARPLSLEIQLSLTDKSVLNKGLAKIARDLDDFMSLLASLGEGWTFHVQQMEVDEESGETTHYQDLFKDDISSLDEDSAIDLFGKASYLNGEANWVTPMYLSQRLDSERVATMGVTIAPVVAERVVALLPVLLTICGRGRQRLVAQAPAAPEQPDAAQAPEPVEAQKIVRLAAPKIEFDVDKGFTFVARLKPLHIRRGFVNLTPEHWPFFALNARTATRPVTVTFEDVTDEESALWRLKPDDTARLVLGPDAHSWLEDNFAPDDKILLTARKESGKHITVELQPVG